MEGILKDILALFEIHNPSDVDLQRMRVTFFPSWNKTNAFKKATIVGAWKWVAYPFLKKMKSKVVAAMQPREIIRVVNPRHGEVQEVDIGTIQS